VRCAEVKAGEPVKQEFIHLEIKKDLYVINYECADCMGGCWGPACCDPIRRVYYLEDGRVKRVQSIYDEFDELFYDLSDEKQLVEFLDFSGYRNGNELMSLDEARKESRRMVQDISECEIKLDLNNLNIDLVVSEQGDGFIYQGFAPYLEGSQVFYEKYKVSEKGVMEKLESKLVEDCGVRIVY